MQRSECSIALGLPSVRPFDTLSGRNGAIQRPSSTTVLLRCGKLLAIVTAIGCDGCYWLWWRLVAVVAVIGYCGDCSGYLWRLFGDCVGY